MKPNKGFFVILGFANKIELNLSDARLSKMSKGGITEVYFIVQSDSN